MRKNIKALTAIELLKTEYPTVRCELNYNKPHELLIATRLSAQCTDKRVNMVTPLLFARFPDVESIAEADVKEVAEIIKTCGLFQTKSKDIVQMCKQIRDDFNGKVPDTMEELLTLSGVGRKTANLILGELYGQPAFICDTHVIRLTNRLGLAEGKDAGKVETQLRKIIPPDESLGFCHRLVRHGRLVCNARKPDCEHCCLNEICKNRPLL